MSTVLEEHRPARAERSGWRPWVLLLCGLAALYVPTCWNLAHGLWREEEYAHGPIILAVFAWLVWSRREVLRDASLRAAPFAGLAVLFAGLFLYLVGRTQSLPLFEVASIVPVVAGALLMVRGMGGVKRFAFPLFFLLFLVPLPGFVLEAITGPLKELVSSGVAGLLSLLGYAVERNGVALTVNGHDLLVADACSGMNSLMSLLALGLLYTQLSGRRSAARVALVLAGMVPIAIAANMARVLLLSLVAVHLGDEAARGWIHDVAGFLVFGVALSLLIGWDKLVQFLLGNATRNTGDRPAFAQDSSVSGSVPGVTYFALVVMVAVAVAAPFLRPTVEAAPIDLEAMIPARFGDWAVEPDAEAIPAAADVQANLDRLYKQVVARTYVNSQGERMMLTVAYGGDQSDALKAHRQEVCYRAQGFEIHGLARDNFSSSGRSIPVTRMLAIRGERSEPVTYWFTMGDRVVLGRLERLKVQLQSGLRGRVPDGMLVRVSSLSNDPRAAFAAQDAFMAGLVATVPAQQASRLVGATEG